MDRFEQLASDASHYAQACPGCVGLMLGFVIVAIGGGFLWLWGML